MLFYIKLYLTSLSVFTLLDLIWLGIVARSFYKAQIGFLLSPTPNWFAAALFYLLFLGGLVFFCVVPSIDVKKSLLSAALSGAFFGCVTYAAYDLTNLATLKNWPWMVTLVDMAWGTFLCATITVVTVWISRFF